MEQYISTVGNILNLPSYRVEGIEEEEHDYHIYAQTVAPCFVCSCGSANGAKWGTHEQLVRDLPIHGKRVGIYVKTRRYRCNECRRTVVERLPGVSDKRTMTDRLVKWIGEQSVKRTFSSVAEDVGVTEGTVRNLFRDYVAELEEQTTFVTPRWLGLDEILLLKKPRGVISNIEERTIVDLLTDRNKRTIVAYLSALPGREKIDVVAMDMWPLYREAVTAVLPQATVVIDKFYVVRMANVAMEAVRKALRSRLEPKERRGLLHDRFVLLNREHDLNESQRFLVDSWSTLYPELGEAYRLKERFFAIYDADDRHEAADIYAKWVASIPPSLRTAFSPITTAWRSWNDAILAYFDHTTTSAYTESVNNLLRVMNRVGRGYSFEALRAKILFTEGLHRRLHARPKFKRLRDTNFDMGAPTEHANSRSTPNELNGRLLGADISTLTELIEGGQF